MQRPRNRRRRQRQDVHRSAELLQPLLVLHPEPLFLVDHHQPQVRELHVPPEQPVRPDQDVHLPRRQPLDHPPRLPLRPEAADDLDRNWVVRHALRERLVVLLGQDRRRDQHRHLLSVHRHLERRADRQLRLPVPHVPANQAVHRPRALHVPLDHLQRRVLVLRLLVREGRLELLLPRRVLRVRDPKLALPERRDLEELPRERLHGLLDPLLPLLPARGPELRELRRPVPSADVLLDEVDLADGDVQLREVRVLDDEELPLLPLAHQPLDPQELPDAVREVHHEVAAVQLQVALDRARLLEPLRDAAHSVPMKQLVVGEEGDREVRDAEAVREPPDARLDPLVPRERGLREHLVEAVLLAGVLAEDDDALDLRAERGELAEEAREVAREALQRPCVHVGAPWRGERREVQARATLEPLAQPRPPPRVQLGALQVPRGALRHERRLDQRDEGPLGEVVEERREARPRAEARELGAADERQLHGLEGPLRGLRHGVEGAQRVDRVAEELQPHGVRGVRPDVDDAASHAELAGRLDERHAVVLPLEEEADHVRHRALLADGELDGGGADGVGVRDVLEDRGGMGDDEEGAAPRGRASLLVRQGAQRADALGEDLGVREDPLRREGLPRGERDGRVGEEGHGVVGQVVGLLEVGGDGEDGLAGVRGERGEEDGVRGAPEPARLGAAVAREPRGGLGERGKPAERGEQVLHAPSAIRRGPRQCR